MNRGTRAKLKEITEKLSEILEQDTDERQGIDGVVRTDEFAFAGQAEDKGRFQETGNRF